MRIICIIIAICISNEVSGCTCAGTIAPDYFALVEIESVNKNNSFFTYKIRTIEQIKGDEQKQVYISRRACLLSIREGEQWMIHGAWEGNRIQTHQCSGSFLFRKTSGEVDVERGAYIRYYRFIGAPDIIKTGPNEIYDNGNILVKENYKNGKLEGERKVFHPNGTIWIVERFKAGRHYGERRIYDKDGTVRRIEGFRTGNKRILFEKHRYSYDDGGLKLTFSVVNEKKEGEELYFHPNGQIELSSCYVEGQRVGPSRRYNHDGTLLSYSYYVKNKVSEDHLSIGRTYKNGVLKYQVIRQHPFEETTTYRSDGSIQYQRCTNIITGEEVQDE